MWTDAQLGAARAKEWRDRALVRRMFVFAIFAGLGIAAFALLDMAGTPIVVAKGSIVERQDVWSFRHGSRCVISLDTGLGSASWTEWKECKSVAWRVGQYFDALRVRRGRVTGWLRVYSGLHS